MKNSVTYLAAAAGVLLITAGVLFFLTPNAGFRRLDKGAMQPGVVQEVTLNQSAVLVSSASLSSLQKGLHEVSQKALPTVVEINVTQTIAQKIPHFSFPFDSPFPFFGQQQGNGVSRLFPPWRQALSSAVSVRPTTC